MLPFLAPLITALGGTAAAAPTVAATAAPVAAGLSTAAAPVAAGLSATAPVASAAAPAAGLSVATPAAATPISAATIEAATAATPTAASAVPEMVQAGQAASKGGSPMWWQKGSTWLDKNLGTNFMDLQDMSLADRLSRSGKMMQVGQSLSGGGQGGQDQYSEQMKRLAELMAMQRQGRG